MKIHSFRGATLIVKVGTVEIRETGNLAEGSTGVIAHLVYRVNMTIDVQFLNVENLDMEHIYVG